MKDFVFSFAPLAYGETPLMEPKDEINEFIEKIASNARGKASNNIEVLQNDSKFKISTKEQKLVAYKMHLALFQKACEKAIYPVSNQTILYDKIKLALESKRVYLDKTFRVWVDYKTKNEVFNGIKSELYKDYTDYYTTLELVEIIDAITNGEEGTSRVSNEEFIKGEITISFINGTVPMFKVKKRLETRNLAAITYIDANLKNWEDAIDKEKEYDKKIELLHNARLYFSTFKYNFPPLEKQVNRAIARLDEIEKYLKYWQNKPKSIIIPEPQNINLEKCLEYINSIEDFNVLTELGRDNGKSLEDFIKMSRAVSFDDIGKGFDEVWELGMKIKNENENLSILMKPVSIKEVLKIFVIDCKKQFELTGIDFLQWLDKKEFDWRKFQKDRVTEINTALESADSKRAKKLKLTKTEVIEMCRHHYKIMELIKNVVLNYTITLNTQSQEKKKTLKALTYKWQGNVENELPALYNKMKGVFIDLNTTLEQFTAIFTAQPSESIIPLKWIDSNRLLAYFLDLSFKGHDWQSIAGHGKLFLNKKGKILTANDLATAKEGFNYGNPKGHNLIDTILKEIKNIKNIKTS